jgi:hypothetical protein
VDTDPPEASGTVDEVPDLVSPTTVNRRTATQSPTRASRRRLSVLVGEPRTLLAGDAAAT